MRRTYNVIVNSDCWKLSCQYSIIFTMWTYKGHSWVLCTPFLFFKQLKKANPDALNQLRDRPQMSSFRSSGITNLYDDAFVSEDLWWDPASNSCKPTTMAASELQNLSVDAGPNALDDTNVLIKHSSDPYMDFRQSMLTMIKEEGLQVTYPKSHMKRNIENMTY